jgi:hypothetical protein
MGLHIEHFCGHRGSMDAWYISAVLCTGQLTRVALPKIMHRLLFTSEHAFSQAAQRPPNEHAYCSVALWWKSNLLSADCSHSAH